jgi:hypothetical protein
MVRLSDTQLRRWKRRIVRSERGVRSTRSRRAFNGVLRGGGIVACSDIETFGTTVVPKGTVWYSTGLNDGARVFTPDPNLANQIATTTGSTAPLVSARIKRSMRVAVCEASDGIFGGPEVLECVRNYNNWVGVVHMDSGRVTELVVDHPNAYMETAVTEDGAGANG